MGADQLAGVMEIVKRKSAESLNKAIDEKLLLEEKHNLAEQAEKKLVYGTLHLKFGMMESLIQEILESIYQWLFQLYITT